MAAVRGLSHLDGALRSSLQAGGQEFNLERLTGLFVREITPSDQHCRNMWGPLEKVQILHIFLLFLQKPALERCWGCFMVWGFFVQVCVSCVSVGHLGYFTFFHERLPTEQQ